MNKLLSLFLVFLCLIGCRQTYFKVESSSIIDKYELVFLHNKERSTKNLDLPMLSRSEILEKRAQDWTDNMAKRKRMYHGSLRGTDYKFIGENVAEGYSTNEIVIKAWMDSRGHKANILNRNYTHIGVGYTKLENGRSYWCVQFAGD